MNLHARWFVSVACCLLLWTTAWGAPEAGPAQEFELEEIPGVNLSRQHYCTCLSEPRVDVTYPVFISDRPLYGEMRLDMELDVPQSGTTHLFAIDESGGTGAGYDRLYVDLDADGRLTDETPMVPLDDPPRSVLSRGDVIAQQVCFEYVTFSSAAETGETYFAETLPRLIVYTNGHAGLSFFPTTMRRGRIRIGGHRFEVVMANNYPLGTRLDRPGTYLKLHPLGVSMRLPSWYYSDRLMAMHEIDGTYWCLSTTPAGDRLFVAPYQGEFGTLTAGSGWGLGGKRGFAGTLRAKDKAVRVGGKSKNDPSELTSSCRIPVGDYIPVMFGVRDGSLFLTVSESHHARGPSGGQVVTPVTYPLKVRADEPCALEIGKDLEVVFASPAEGAQLAPGADLFVSAVLVDPKLDVMVRDLRARPGLRMTSHMGVAILFLVAIPVLVLILPRKIRRRYWLPVVLSCLALLVLAGAMGALHAVSRRTTPRAKGIRGYDQLNPRVTISRSDGEVVAEGVMPFG